MLKIECSFIALAFMALQACAPTSTEEIGIVETSTEEQAEFARYTDAHVELMIQQLASLTSDGYSTPLPEDVLAQLGIAVEGLDQADLRVGDCYCQTKYDLSPSYWLWVDRNLCFGLAVWIEPKDTSG